MTADRQLLLVKWNVYNVETVLNCLTLLLIVTLLLNVQLVASVYDREGHLKVIVHERREALIQSIT